MNQQGLTPAAEGPPTMYTTPPPDQQPQDMQGAVAMVASIVARGEPGSTVQFLNLIFPVIEAVVFRDGGMDMEEQAAFSGFVQRMIAQAQAAAQQGYQQQAQQPTDLGQPQPTDSGTVPFNGPDDDEDMGY